MEFTRKSLPEQHYLYIEKEVSMSDGAAIGQAMGEAFMGVMGFTAQNGIQPLSMPISLYLAMPTSDMMTFRGGVFVSPEDAAKANGDVMADHIPACDVMMTTHTGPYSQMNVSHNALWTHMESLGLSKMTPIWEIYVDDPTTVPEADCRTELYRAIG